MPQNLNVLDGAQLVRVETVGLIEVLQVWYGGTTVNVFRRDESGREPLTEIDVWTAYDDNGRPLERSQIEGMMRDHFREMHEETR